jgi:hypothetical protein
MHSGLSWENLQGKKCLEEFDVELKVNVRLDIKQYTLRHETSGSSCGSRDEESVSLEFGNFLII